MGTKTIRDADVLLKEFWSRNDRFADLFNGTVFGGEPLLKPEQLQEMDTDVSGQIRGKRDIGLSDQTEGKKEADISGQTKRDIDILDHTGRKTDTSLSSQSKTKVYTDTLERHRDIIKKSAYGIEFVILAIENQKKIHYAMPLRTMLYDGLGYQKELEELTYRRKQEKSLHTAEEFLSGMKKDNRLHPIITLVISYSEDIWDGPLCLKDMVVEMPEKIERIFSDYKINLIEIRKGNEYHFHNEDVKTLFGVTRYIYEREFDEMKKEYKDKKLSSEMLKVLGSVTGSKELTELGEQETEVTGNKMCRALEEWREEGVQLGYESGRQAGYENGFQKSEDQLVDLISILCKTGRMDEIRQIVTDADYLQKLKDEFHIS